MFDWSFLNLLLASETSPDNLSSEYSVFSDDPDLCFSGFLFFG